MGRKPEKISPAAVRQLFLPYQSGTVLVGFSGGADSTAALLVCQAVQKLLPFRLVAVHFAHNLRGAESETEAQQAAEFAQKLPVEFRRIDFNLDAQAPGLEERARSARLAAWQKLQQEYPAPVAVVTGHHADDRTETMLLMLCRGANSSGASTLRAHACVNGVHFVRPLLEYSRGDIEEFLRTRHIDTWAQDSSNSDTAYSRNYWRGKLLPELYVRFPGSEQALHHAVHNLELDAQFIERCAREKFAQGDCTQLEFWRACDPALRPRLLRLWLVQQGGTDRPLPAGVWPRLSAELERDSLEPRQIPLGEAWCMELRHNQVRLLPSVPASPASVTWHFRTETVEWGRWQFRAFKTTQVTAPGRYRVYFDGAALPEILTIRAPLPGDRLTPWGQTAPVKVKKLRCNAQVPATPAIPVVTTPEEIIWLPGIRRGAQGAVTPHTVEIWCLESFIPKDEDC